MVHGKSKLKPTDNTTLTVIMPTGKAKPSRAKKRKAAPPPALPAVKLAWDEGDSTLTIEAWKANLSPATVKSEFARLGLLYKDK